MTPEPEEDFMIDSVLRFIVRDLELISRPPPTDLIYPDCELCNQCDFRECLGSSARRAESPWSEGVVKTHPEETPSENDGFELVGTNKIDTKDYCGNPPLRPDTGPKARGCALCGRSFDNQGELRRHLRFVHPNHRPHSCGVCSQNFIERGHLKRHLSLFHTKRATFRCQVCDKKFRRRIVQEKALSASEERARAVCFPCRKHLSDRLPDPIPPVGRTSVRETLHRCQCGRSYTRKDSFRRHSKRCTVIPKPIGVRTSPRFLTFAEKEFLALEMNRGSGTK
ncbi:zinc finger protein 554 [Galendromus occidentalis]|uniref:Zinc finger protein 554 n=1 Tax=Galendromus occidentalis TaxID=34638 RepID=A0AAJ6QZ64_9ACAR|nr:zinc finger protein 554 [Galendromus occidentalis]